MAWTGAYAYTGGRAGGRGMGEEGRGRGGRLINIQMNKMYSGRNLGAASFTRRVNLSTCSSVRGDNNFRLASAGVSCCPHPPPTPLLPPSNYSHFFPASNSFIAPALCLGPLCVSRSKGVALRKRAACVFLRGPVMSPRASAP